MLRRRWIRIAAPGVVAALAVAGVVVFGADRGHPAQLSRLLSGAAWLSSAQVGQLTLLDGSTAEVAAQVQVASRGNTLDIVQQGASAYAVDRTAGTIRRVDGATFDLTEPMSPIPDAHNGLAAFAGRDILYTLDTQRGVLATSDPKTLAPRGKPLSLATQLTAGAASLDESGRLWLVDTGTGDLTRISDERRTTQRKAAPTGDSILTVAGGVPVIVHPAERTATIIDPDTGAPHTTLELDLRPTDKVAVSGSPHGQRLYLTASRGLLLICTLTGCDNIIPLNDKGDLGAPVEAGNRLFVPDYATGQVWIVNLSDQSIIAKPQVLDPAGQFQLLARDGIVFFNDPNTERAGVVRLDGTVIKTAKYDPKDPSKGLNTPDDTNPGDKQATDPGQPDPGQPDPGQQPDQPRPDQSTPDPTQPRQPNPGQPQPNQPPTSTPRPPPTSPGPQPEPQPTLRITLSKANPTVHEEITLRVGNTTGPAPTDAQWDFGNGQTGSGVTTSHAWATARTHQVSVQATLPGGKQASTSVSLPVGAMPAPALVSPADGTVYNEYEPTTTVTWRAVAGAARYHLEMQCSGCDSAPGWMSWIDITTAETSHTFEWLRDDYPRRWRVTAIAADNSPGAPSGWWGFSHDHRIHPPKPTPIGPPDGSQFNTVPRNVTVSWQPQGNTEYFVLEVEAMQSPGAWTQVVTTPVGSDSDPQTSHTFEFPGAFPGRWRVKGVSATVTSGPWSDWWHFEFTA